MDRIEREIVAAIEENRARIAAFADDIFRHPELSDRETRTAARVAEALAGLPLSVRTGVSGTGVLGMLGEARPCVALIGELDAVRCPGHPFADPETGAAHACGHHAQLAAVYGAALALTRPGVREALAAGSVALFAVPAEEQSGGKCRLLSEGEFDGMDVAVTHHTHYVPTDADLVLGSMPSNGVIFKRIVFTGRASHAGGAPHEGINALAAASVGMTAIGFLRETFRDEDRVRVHGIVREGGAAHNVIPERVVLEYGVRAKRCGALDDAGRKVNRAFEGGALALGAKVAIDDVFRYAPMRYRAAEGWQREIGALLLPEARRAEVSEGDFNPASTDVGDLGEKMPVMNFTTGGFSGALHSAEYRMEDVDTALLLPAKVMALSAYRLLRHGAEEARRLIPR